MNDSDRWYYRAAWLALGAGAMFLFLMFTGQIDHDPWTPPSLDGRFLESVNEQLDTQTEGTLGLGKCETCEGRGDRTCPECDGAGWAVFGIAPEGSRPQPAWYAGESPTEPALVAEAPLPELPPLGHLHWDSKEEYADYLADRVVRSRPANRSGEIVIIVESVLWNAINRMF